MSTGLTDDDLDRIRRFLETPAYARTPEQLLPGDADDDDSDTATDPGERAEGGGGERMTRE